MAFGVWGHKQTFTFWVLVDVPGEPVRYITHRFIPVRVQVPGTLWKAQKGCLPAGQFLGSAPRPARGSGPKGGATQVSVTQALSPEERVSRETRL